jgi:predicted transcriptional regulator of viral defense system
LDRRGALGAHRAGFPLDLRRHRRRDSPRDGDVSRNRVSSRPREEIARGERSSDLARPERIAVSDRERTIADALASPDWVGGIRHLAQMLRSYRSTKDWNPNRLLERVGEVRSGAAFKRLGYLAEIVLSAESVLVDAALARRSAGVVKLDPAVAGRGRLTKRWGLWVNARLDASPSDT